MCGGVGKSAGKGRLHDERKGAERVSKLMEEGMHDAVVLGAEELVRSFLDDGSHLALVRFWIREDRYLYLITGSHLRVPAIATFDKRRAVRRLKMLSR